MRNFLPNIAVTEQKLQLKAAPAGHDGVLTHALVTADKGDVGDRQQVQVGCCGAQRVVAMLAVRAVGEAQDGVQAPLPAQSLDQLRHELLAALAASNVVGVRERFVGHERDVRTADDRRDPALAQRVGEVVRLGDRRRGGGEADEVGVVHVVPINWFQIGHVYGDVVALLFEHRTDHRQTETGRWTLL